MSALDPPQTTPPQSHWKPLLGCTGKQRGPASRFVLLKQHEQGVSFKTKAFIAKNALDMKKQKKQSATGHRYKTMHNDHMVEPGAASAGHDFNGTKGL